MPVTVENIQERKSNVRPSHFGGPGGFMPGGHELRTLHSSSPPPASTAIWVGIAAIMMMFAGFTSALVVRQGAGMDWQHIALPNILLLNTLFLIMSSVTAEIFRRRFRTIPSAGDAHAHAVWLYSTLVLGMLFVIGQYIAWVRLNQEGLYVATNPNCSFFYVLTGVHAVHVLGGLGGLIYVIAKFRSARLRRTTLDTATTYWHFMDVLWLYLLGLLWFKL